ncbi:MAG: asparagine synthase (glutamine-hydrolyzing) [Ginsengibacter sp.]
MCGITGYICFNGSKSDRVVLERMNNSINHRGPDDEGIFIDGKIGLGHRRLSILDLSSAGHQPMLSADGKLAIVFNGEIFNFSEIRKELLTLGHNFTSQTDTEVILNSFVQWGVNCFKMFNGMFAFAIWDREQNDLFVVRDRFGIKPLYYSYSEMSFAFASEVKALLVISNGTMHINDQALVEYMWYGNSLGENTMYAGIKKLLPGHYLKVKETNITETSYWSFVNLSQDDNCETEVSIVRRTKHLLENSVKSHLISDVPVGIFLSGGIDSSAITAFASKHYSGKIDTFSVGFDFDRGVNELAKAKSVAEFFGTNHHELHIRADDLPGVIDTLIDFHDEPFADAANIPLYLLSRELHRSIKVVLQGDGGDEVFGGYSRYHTLQNIKKWKIISSLLNFLPQNFSSNSKWQQLKRFLSAIGQQNDFKRSALLLTVETEENLPLRVLNPEIRNRLSHLNPFDRYKQLDDQYSHLDVVQKMFFTDCSIILPDTFLEKVDKSTMANSLEVRVPFLDNYLTEYIMKLPSQCKVKNGEQKYLLKAALRGIVPDRILDAPKTGFSVPYGYWLRTKLNSYMKDVLLSDDPRVHNIFDRKVLAKLIDEHMQGKGYHSFLLWKCLNLGIWIKKHNATMEIF